MLKLVISPFAKSQVKDVVQYYVTEASHEIAKRFRDDFAQSSQFLAENPGVGSLRFAHLLQEFELRTWSLHRFPSEFFISPRQAHSMSLRLSMSGAMLRLRCLPE